MAVLGSGGLDSSGRAKFSSTSNSKLTLSLALYDYWAPNLKRMIASKMVGVTVVKLKATSTKKYALVTEL